jgi:hypothetical protein
MVDVDGGLRLREEHAFASPVLEVLGGSGVLILGVVVTRLLAVEDQPYGVGRVLLVKLLLQFWADHIVWRGDYIAERAHVPQVVTDSAEGLNVWQESICAKECVARETEQGFGV